MRPGKPAQATLYNSYQAAKQLMDHLETTARCTGKEIILIDDYVNTRWTFTVAGNMLLKEGATSVAPFALLMQKVMS
jgi:ATP-dependent DNA helicase RecQ